MNRRTCIRTGTIAALFTAFGLPTVLARMGDIGSLSPAEFTKTNEDAAAMLKALKSDGKPFIASDLDLLKEIALGGIGQLELSKLAMEKATSPDIKAYAMAEVDEQTLLSTKLKEFAAGGGGTLPTAPDKMAAEIISGLKAKSGASFDKAYLMEGGVNGHMKLLATMERVQAKAVSPVLKALAATTLPLIKTHLQVAKDETPDVK